MKSSAERSDARRAACPGVRHRVERGDADRLEKLLVRARGAVGSRAPVGGTDARGFDGGANPAAQIGDFHGVRSYHPPSRAAEDGRTPGRRATLIAISPPNSARTRLSTNPARASIDDTPAAPG